MICYKDRYQEDPVFAIDPRRATTRWSSQVVGRPENYLTGLSFTHGGYIRMGGHDPMVERITRNVLDRLLA